MMNEVAGVVVKASKQWWLRVRKPIKFGIFSMGKHPYIITVKYIVDGVIYSKKKWIRAGNPVPAVGENVTVRYETARPSKAEIVL